MLVSVSGRIVAISFGLRIYIVGPQTIREETRELAGRKLACVWEKARKDLPRLTSAYYTRYDQNGRYCFSLHRCPGSYAVHIPDCGRFELDLNGVRVHVQPLTGTPPNLLDYFFYNLVAPLALRLQGLVVLHASAVLANQSAILFLGNSGSGKSTLAAALATFGWPFFADDAVILEQKNTCFNVLPGRPAIHLRDDSAQVLFESAFCEDGCESGVKPAMVANGIMPQAMGDYPLSTIFILANESEEIGIEPVSGAERVISITEQLFRIKEYSKADLNSQFREVAELASSVPMFRISYPRSYSYLGPIKERIDTVLRTHAV